MNIDREVAEKVFGFIKEGPAPDHWKCDAKYSYTNNHGEKGCCLDCNLKPYSTNIEHAMEVEAEMFRRGLSIWMTHDYHTGYNVWFEHESGANFQECSSESLPEAICKAALAALEE